MVCGITLVFVAVAPGLFGFCGLGVLEGTRVGGNMTRVRVLVRVVVRVIVAVASSSSS